MRAYILKARREGVSTYVEGRFFWEINAKPMRFACVCSADIDATNKVFEMSNRYQDYLPDEIKRKTKYSSRKEIVYSDPHLSQFLCQTAGKDVLGRGGLTHYLHATEFAFWSRAKAQLGGALQEVPDDPDTIIAIESTANGAEGAFYDLYTESVDDWEETGYLGNFIPIFLPWWIFEDYKRPLYKGFELDYEEKEIQKEFKLSLEQMSWRRWAIKNKCQNDISLFRQEYPATWIEAFQASGSPVFDSDIIRVQKQYMASETRKVLFSRDGLVDGDRNFNVWQIFRLPLDGHQYCMGIDTMEGRLSDVSDVKSKRDCDAVVILDRNEGDVVAIYHGRGAQDELGKQCLLAAEFYNDAWVAPEIPHSMILLNIFKEHGYGNLYNRVIHDERIDSSESENLGWRTTMITRKWLVDDLKAALTQRALRVRFQSIISEMETFVKDKTGKPIHANGKHDDLLFALMIALQVHKQCPLKDMPYPDDHTSYGEDDDFNADDICFSGARDPASDIFEDEEDYAHTY
jgi:hypothetical protein